MTGESVVIRSDQSLCHSHTDCGWGQREFAMAKGPSDVQQGRLVKCLDQGHNNRASWILNQQPTNCEASSCHCCQYVKAYPNSCAAQTSKVWFIGKCEFSCPTESELPRTLPHERRLTIQQMKGRNLSKYLWVFLKTCNF